MKKCLTIAMGLLIAFSLTAFTNAPKTIKNQVNLEDKGLELILDVDKLAECKALTELYTSDPEITEIINTFANGEYSNPKGVFILSNLDAFVYKNMIAPEVKLPSDIEEMLKERLVDAFPSQINAMNGAIILAATSMLSHGDSFIYEGLQNTETYVYIFDNGYNFMVTFIPDDENIVNARVSLVADEELSKCTTQDNLTDYFRKMFPATGMDVSVPAKK